MSEEVHSGKRCFYKSKFQSCNFNVAQQLFEMASVNWMLRMILKPLLPKLASNQPNKECLVFLPRYQLYVDFIQGIVGVATFPQPQIDPSCRFHPFSESFSHLEG